MKLLLLLLFPSIVAKYLSAIVTIKTLIFLRESASHPRNPRQVFPFKAKVLLLASQLGRNFDGCYDFEWNDVFLKQGRPDSGRRRRILS